MDIAVEVNGREHRRECRHADLTVAANDTTLGNNNGFEAGPG